MIRKYWKLLSVFIIVFLILSACSANPIPSLYPPQQSTAIPLTITIWHHWSADKLKAHQAIFTQYMHDHPNVNIVLDAPQDIQRSLQLTIPSISGPDIISWGNDAIGNYAKSGYIAELGRLGITQDWLTSTYAPAAAKGMLWQGKIWALPESQDTIALVYDKALVSAADFPADPMDFAGLLAKAKAYAGANPGKYLVCNQGLGAADAYYEAPIYFGFGVPGYVDDTGKVYVNTQQAIAAANWIVEFSAYAPKQTLLDTCKSGFMDRTFAAWWTGLNALSDIQKAGIDYGILPMGRPYVGIEALMITNNAVSRNTAAVALDLIKYFTNTSNQVQQTLANETIPANTGALNDPRVQALTTMDGFGAAANLGIYIPTTPYADAQWAPIGDATMEIWNGSETPEQALSAAQAIIESVISSMK